MIEAESAAYAAFGIGNHGGAFGASKRSDASTNAAREAIADLVGAPSPQGVVLGPSSTALAYRFAQALGRTWRAGDEIVVTRLDHEANVRPWVQEAERLGVTVRWAEPDLTTLDLPDGIGDVAAHAKDPAGRRDRRLERRRDPPGCQGDRGHCACGGFAGVRRRRARHTAWPG